MYVVAAERQGSTPACSTAPSQTDIFKEYIAQKEWLFEPEPHLRLIGDLMEYCAENIPAYKPLSVSGYHIREAGSTAAQELAYTLADGFGYVELGLSRGLDIEVRPGLSFFFDSHLDFFEEIAKFRAAAASGPAGCVTSTAPRPTRPSGCASTPRPRASLTASSPTTTSCAPPWRHLPLSSAAPTACTPTPSTRPWPSHEQAAEIALRTQRDDRGDRCGQRRRPAGGNWYVEALTDKIEAEAEKIFDRILTLGGGDLTSKDTAQLAETVRANVGKRDGGTWPMTAGILRGIEEGWFMSEIAEAAFPYQVALEKGGKKVVGVNCHTESVSHELEILRVSHEVEREQVATLGQRKDWARRDRGQGCGAAHGRGLADPRQHGPRDARRRAGQATLGEICDALRDSGVSTASRRGSRALGATSLIAMCDQ